MKFPKIKNYLTGVAVPLSSLKSQENSGIGEFPDLVKLGKWCQETGIGLIQLLPLSDTGYESSPYSALSAFALHPVYLNLDTVPGAQDFKSAISGLRTKYVDLPTVAFQDILRDKLDILKKIFHKNVAQWKDDAALAAWIKDNPWSVEYAVFSTLKHRRNLAGWQDWPDFRTPKKAEIEKFWKDEANLEETRFFCWLQYLCEGQLSSATKELEKLGVALKGDIPILINEDSHDVWANPELFSLDLRAGAPPDGGSPEGQNWGFPIYRWENLAKDGYRWWKNRIKQADKFFHAYRIDHVLGFFRIWATPAANRSANLGYFLPNRPIKKQELQNLGFDEGRITWLSEPHIFGQELRDALGDEHQKAVGLCLSQVGQEDLFRFRSDIKGEKAIAQTDLSDRAKQVLYGWFRNRTLLRISEQEYIPLYTYYATRAYESLGQEEKWNFDKLIQETILDAETLWEKQGNELMDFMKNTADMLVCAEDLGVIPDCVPRILASHEILGLKIVRWARNWNHPGQPYYPVKNYPLLSVCTPSVHDTSSLRQWWYEERDHRDFLDAIDVKEDPHQDYTPELAQKIISGLMGTSSLLAIFAIQDLLAMDSGLRPGNPDEERINFPGTVSERNWSYKMKPSLEILHSQGEFNKMLKSIIHPRSIRKVSL